MELTELTKPRVALFQPQHSVINSHLPSDTQYGLLQTDPLPQKIQSNFRVVNTHCFLHCKFRKPWIYYDSLTGTKYTNYKKER